jgi:hypothetical protein
MITKYSFLSYAFFNCHICVTDSWKLADFHKLIMVSRIKEEKKMTIKRYAGKLGWQLLTNTLSIAAGDLGLEPTSSSPSVTVTMNSMETVPSITSTNEISIEYFWSVVDANGKTHYLVLLPKSSHNKDRDCFLSCVRKIFHVIPYHSVRQRGRFKT